MACFCNAEALLNGQKAQCTRAGRHTTRGAWYAFADIVYLRPAEPCPMAIRLPLVSMLCSIPCAVIIDSAFSFPQQSIPRCRGTGIFRIELKMCLTFIHSSDEKCCRSKPYQARRSANQSMVSAQATVCLKRAYEYLVVDHTSLRPLREYLRQNEITSSTW